MRSTITSTIRPSRPAGANQPRRDDARRRFGRVVAATWSRRNHARGPRRRAGESDRRASRGADPALGGVAVGPCRRFAPLLRRERGRVRRDLESMKALVRGPARSNPLAGGPPGSRSCQATGAAPYRQSAGRAKYRAVPERSLCRERTCAALGDTRIEAIVAGAWIAPRAGVAAGPYASPTGRFHSVGTNSTS